MSERFIDDSADVDGMGDLARPEQGAGRLREDVARPQGDVLEEGLLHKVMLFFHIPAHWPAWLVVGTLLFGAILVGGVWWLVLQHALAATVMITVLFAFMVGDMLILASLPRKQLSFGPWKSQVFSLAVPRGVVVMGMVVLAYWLGWKWGVALTAVILTAGTLMLWYGATVEPFKLTMSEFHMFSDRLPYGTPEIRLLHITDLHIERLTRREALLLDLVKEARPDLIVLTGDYVNLSYNRDPITHQQVHDLLQKLEAPYGVYATLGSPPVDLRETVVPIFDDLPVKLLREDNEEVCLGNGRYLALIGMDCTHNLHFDSGRLEELAKSAPTDMPQVLLYHSPELMPEASNLGVDLYLCGHTHGGQVRLPLIGPLLTSSQLGRRFVMGIYRIGRTHLYVSRGVGLEGLSAPRVRFKAPPEITLVTLHARGKPVGGRAKIED